MARSSYAFSDGFRLAIPHLDKMRVRVKGSWVGKETRQVMRNYLSFISEENLDAAFSCRRVMVSGTPVGPSHTLALGQTLELVFHRHEPAVLDEPVQILHTSEDLVVVNKPSSIPVHPIGRFKKNSVIEILRYEHPELVDGGKELKLMHRLDRLVSGVLILARSQSAASQLQKHMFQNFLEKEYIARVKGTFPLGRLEVCQPITKLQSDPPVYGVPSCVMDSGTCRTAHTVFERVSVAADGSESLVRCRPITGRSHQIRVHLQWLGHPISNDCKYCGTYSNQSRRPPEPAPESYSRVEWCSECQAGRRDISRVSQEDLGVFSIWLHSLSYANTHPLHQWNFKAPQPHWTDFSYCES